MKIIYKNKKLEKICTNLHDAERKYGSNMAFKIHLRIKEISASLSVEDMIRYRIGRCHQLKGKRNNQYAVDLDHPFRLIFEKRNEEIELVKIIEITDYH